MGQYFTKKERSCRKKSSLIKNTMKLLEIRIFMKHGPFTGPEIDVFVEENLNRPVLEEIFNDFKGNEDIRNAMKKYGVTTIHPTIPHLIYLEFFIINESLIEQKEH